MYRSPARSDAKNTLYCSLGRLVAAVYIKIAGWILKIGICKRRTRHDSRKVSVPILNQPIYPRVLNRQAGGHEME